MGEIAFSIVLLIIGIIAGGLVTFKLQKHKEPTYFFQSHSIFEDSASKHDGLSVRYNNTTINGLTSVYLAFWNSGKETITSNHIVEDIEITLINRAGVKSDNGRTGLLGSVFGLFFDIYEEIKDTRHTGTKQNILNAQVVIQTRDSNKFQATLSEDGLSVKLDFKYIEHNDGAVIHLLSEGSIAADINLDGRIMGCKKIKKTIPRSLKEAFLSSLLTFIAFSWIILLLNMIAYMAYNSTYPEYIDYLNTRYSIIVLSSSLIIWFLLTLFFSAKSEPVQKVPKHLRKYFHDVFHLPH